MASGDDQGSGTTKKAASKKSTTKKATTRKSAATKSTAKRASAPRASARPQSSPARLAQEAAAQLSELTGHEVEAVTALERTDDGWTVQVEVVELRRIPSTTDVLAIYDIQVDGHGDLQGYRRVDRYSRGDTRSDQ
jgi:hypothetical protein